MDQEAEPMGQSTPPELAPDAARGSGVVKWFSKGIGFVEQDGKEEKGLPDLFVHYSNIDMEGFKVVYPKDRVTFVAAEGKRGPIALKVRKAE